MSVFLKFAISQVAEKDLFALRLSFLRKQESSLFKAFGTSAPRFRGDKLRESDGGLEFFRILLDFPF
jgi:hypothetical protein